MYVYTQCFIWLKIPIVNNFFFNYIWPQSGFGSTHRFSLMKKVTTAQKNCAEDHGNCMDKSYVEEGKEVGETW